MGFANVRAGTWQVFVRMVETVRSRVVNLFSLSLLGFIVGFGIYGERPPL